MSDAADPILIEAAIGGDEHAFAELVARHQAAVWNTVHRILGNSAESEDAVQEVFLRAMVALPRFDRRYPFGPWVLRIASNYCIDQLRRRKSRKYKLWTDLSEAEESRALRTMSTETELENPATEDPVKYLRIAWSLLDRLKPKRRVAFVLREIEGHTYEAVARILGVREVTARVRVWRARADLHREFRKHSAELDRGARNEKTL